MPQELTNNVTDTALIFEGGGMRASYTAAVVAALLDAGIHFNWVAGISAGSSHTVNYASRDADRSRKSFVDLAADPNFGGLKTFVQGKGMFNAEYIYQQSGLAEGAFPYDFETFQANPGQIRLGTFQADTGKAFYWGKEDCPTLDELMLRVRSSSTLPVLMPTVTIGDHKYVDGAMGPSGGVPLDAAQADGFDRYFVVLTRPKDFVKKPMRVGLALRRQMRDFPAVLDALEHRHENYNRTREELLDLERDGKAMIFYPTGYTVSTGEHSVAKIARSYDEGAAQAKPLIPEWKEWLGLA